VASSASRTGSEFLFGWYYDAIIYRPLFLTALLVLPYFYLRGVARQNLVLTPDILRGVYRLFISINFFAINRPSYYGLIWPLGYPIIYMDKFNVNKTLRSTYLTWLLFQFGALSLICKVGKEQADNPKCAANNRRYVMEVSHLMAEEFFSRFWQAPETFARRGLNACRPVANKS